MLGKDKSQLLSAQESIKQRLEKMWGFIAGVFGLFQIPFTHGFTKNMKLEAVNPRDPAEICVASIASVKGSLMWLHLEGKLESLQNCSKVIILWGMIF